MVWSSTDAAGPPSLQAGHTSCVYGGSVPPVDSFTGRGRCTTTGFEERLDSPVPALLLGEHEVLAVRAVQAHRVAKLRQELVGIVAAYNVMRDRHTDRCCRFNLATFAG